MTRGQSKVHVTVEAVVLYQDQRGSVFEPLEPAHLPGQRHVHVVVTEPGCVRGNHAHTSGTEVLTVQGPALVRFRAEIASGDAYEGRQDLGNTQPGDGPRFKGRGLIQLTGRANYREYGRAIGREAALLADPELLATDPDLCADVAGWFWAKRGLNPLADADDLTGITRRINGGLNGLEDRRRLLKRAKAVLSF